MEQPSKKRYIPNPHVRERLQRAANDPRLSEYRREQALARLRDIARLESGIPELSPASTKQTTTGSSEVMPLLMYILGPSTFFCVMAAMVPAIIIFGDAGWAWLIHDRVMAIIVFERGIMNADPLAEIVLGGVAMGVLVSIGMIVYRWINGYWPHQS